jgi:hypothetical protein
MKTAERAHMPNKMWERVKLPKNYEDAMEVINKHLVWTGSLPDIFSHTNMPYCHVDMMRTIKFNYMLIYLCRNSGPSYLCSRSSSD